MAPPRISFENGGLLDNGVWGSGISFIGDSNLDRMEKFMGKSRIGRVGMRPLSISVNDDIQTKYVENE